MEFTCDSMDGKMCTSRDYRGNHYENECHNCCLTCKHAKEMSCSIVCKAVVEYYYPEQDEL